MTKDEALKLAMEAMEITGGFDVEINAIKEALMSVPDVAQPEPWEKFCDSSCVWTDHHPDCKLAQQEPVAWMHTKLDGVVVPHRPADLDRHPDRWEALYKNTQPCPTCEALARTVMLDQTSHDTTPPQRTWVGLTLEELSEIYNRTEWDTVTGWEYERAIEAKLKEKNT